MLGDVDNIRLKNGGEVLQFKFSPQEKANVTRSQGPFVVHLHEIVGRGSFGAVYRATCSPFGTCAVKVSGGKRWRLEQELAVMARVCNGSSSHVIRMHFGGFGSHGGSEQLFIGMELCSQTTLHDVLLRGKVSSSVALLYSRQVVQAVADVHAAGCVHRDIKLQNFVLCHDGNTLKLVDFGIAAETLVPPKGDVVAGTVAFMAPEMAHNVLCRDDKRSVGEKADVWSAGIVLFSIVCQRNPYEALNTNETREALLDVVRKGLWTWPPNVHVRADIKSLVESMLEPDELRRPSMQEVLKSACWDSLTSASSHSENSSKKSVARSLSQKFSTPAAITAMEKSSRVCLRNLLSLQLEQLHQWINIIIEEDTERYDMKWLMHSQREYVDHPHRFTHHQVVRKGDVYRAGFVCDDCHIDNAPQGNQLERYHCSCGMDLCPNCYQRRINKKGSAPRKGSARAVAQSTQEKKRPRTDPALRSPPRPPAPPPVAPRAVATAGPWLPFASLLRRDVGLQPTDVEREALLRGDWVRYFHFYPQEAPTILAYHIQAGRTGGMFISNTMALHSAIASPFENSLFLVEHVDAGGGTDRTRRITTAACREEFPDCLGVLSSVMAHDSNMIKLRRPLGVQSVHTPPIPIRSAATDAVVYVRWMRSNPDTGLTAFSLSNGAVQVFLRGSVEVRWVDEARKFWVRPAGVCELIDESAVEVQDALRELTNPLTDI